MQIVIVHHPDSIDWLTNLLPTLKGCRYNYHIFTNPRHNSGYELAALEWAAKTFPGEDIVLLQDSCEIKNHYLFSLLEASPGGVAICQHFQSYMGKYSGKVLAQMAFPKVKNKEESIWHEGEWNREYMSKDPNFRYFEQMLSDNPMREMKFGRENMVLENDYIKKYKGRWR